jgi:hypothetical protein
MVLMPLPLYAVMRQLHFNHQPSAYRSLQCCRTVIPTNGKNRRMLKHMHRGMCQMLAWGSVSRLSCSLCRFTSLGTWLAGR